MDETHDMHSRMERNEKLSLFVVYPNKRPVLREVDISNLTNLRHILQIYDDQEFVSHFFRSFDRILINHHTHKDQFFVVESIDQIWDGATLKVTVPSRRILVTFTAMSSVQKEVIWFPGATSQQIETSVRHVCGIPLDSDIEFFDKEERVVVLSSTIPNDTELTVRIVTSPGTQVLSPNAPVPPAPINPLARKHGAGPGVANHTSQQLYGSQAHPHPAFHPAFDGDFPDYPLDVTQPSVAVQRLNNNTFGSSNRSTGRPASASARGRTPPGGSSSRQATSARQASARGTALRQKSQTPAAANPGATDKHLQQECVHMLAGHSGPVTALQIVGDVLFSGSQDSSIMIWDLNNLQYIGALPGHKAPVKCLAASMDRKLLASGSADKSIKLWSLDTFACEKTFQGHHTAEVLSLAIIEERDLLASGSADKSIRLWCLNELKPILILEHAHSSDVFTLHPILGRGLLVSGSRDRCIKVWDSANWESTRTLHPPHYDSVTCFTSLPNGLKFYSGSRDKSIKEWDLATLTSSVHGLHLHQDWITAMTYSPHLGLLFTASKDGTIKGWDAHLVCRCVLIGHQGTVTSLWALNEYLFSGGADRIIRVWKPNTPGGGNHFN